MKTPTNIDWTPLAGIKPEKRGRGYSQFTQEEGERIRAFYYQSGLSARVIAEHLGSNTHTIYKNIHRQTKHTRPLLKTLTTEQLRKYHKRHIDGQDIESLSRDIGCHPASLRYQFHKRGWYVWTYAEAFRKRKDAMVQELRKGTTPSQAREKLGIGMTAWNSAMKSIRRDLKIWEAQQNRWVIGDGRLYK